MRYLPLLHPALYTFLYKASSVTSAVCLSSASLVSRGRVSRERENSFSGRLLAYVFAIALPYCTVVLLCGSKPACRTPAREKQQDSLKDRFVLFFLVPHGVETIRRKGLGELDRRWVDGWRREFSRLFKEDGRGGGGWRDPRPLSEVSPLPPSRKEVGRAKGIVGLWVWAADWVRRGGGRGAWGVAKRRRGGRHPSSRESPLTD